MPPETSTPATEVTLPVANTEGQQQAPGSDAPPKWFTDFAAKVDGRFGQIGKDFGRVREKLGVKEQPDGESVKPSVENAQMAFKLGRAMNGLNADAQAYVQNMIDEGRAYKDVLSAAELIGRFGNAAASAGASAPMAPTGVAASAASRTSPAWPQDLESLQALKKDNAKLYNELMAPNHPFDPTVLPWKKRG